MMLKSVERLLEFVGDMNATEVNDHIKARPDGFAVSFRIDNEWLDGWNRAVLATIEKIEKEVSERFMELPVDADGEVWHVGDFVVGEVNPRNPKAIERMLWYGPDSGWQLETDTIIYPCPDRPRHHHTPTVEDVLTEFGIDWEHESDCEDRAALLKEYAAKLRLAGDAE